MQIVSEEDQKYQSTKRDGINFKVYEDAISPRYEIMWGWSGHVVAVFKRNHCMYQNDQYILSGIYFDYFPDNFWELIKVYLNYLISENLIADNTALNTYAIMESFTEVDKYKLQKEITQCLWDNIPVKTQRISPMGWHDFRGRGLPKNEIDIDRIFTNVFEGIGERLFNIIDSYRKHILDTISINERVRGVIINDVELDCDYFEELDSNTGQMGISQSAIEQKKKITPSDTPEQPKEIEFPDLVEETVAAKPERPPRVKGPDVVISGQDIDDISIIKCFLILLVCLFIIVLVTGCSSDHIATDKLESKGYTNIQTHGYGGSECVGRNPWIATRFTARDSTGKPVRGSVCLSMFGNYVVVKRD